MTTPPESTGGVPYLPPPGDPTPTDIAQALRDPDLIAATEVPYLPPAAPPRPAVAAPPVFDAKCRQCSLIGVCQPEVLARRGSARAFLRRAIRHALDSEP